MSRQGDNQERALMSSVARLRESHGDVAASAAMATLVKCLEFIRQQGHGNITISVKDHRVARKLRLEHYVDLGEEN